MGATNLSSVTEAGNYATNAVGLIGTGAVLNLIYAMVKRRERMKTGIPLTLAIFIMAGCASLAAVQPGTVLWRYYGGNGIYSAPAPAPDGTIYLVSDGGLCAVTNNGVVASNRWCFPAGGGSSPAIGPDGTIYIVGGEGNLHAMNPDGSQKWSYPAQAGQGSPGIGWDDSVYVEGYQYLYAVSASGSNKWKSAVMGSRNYSSPAVGLDGSIYVGSYEQHAFYAFASDGSQKWLRDSTFLDAVPCDSAAVAQDGTILVTAGSLYAFAPDGTNVWRTTTNNCLGACPVIGPDGTIYAGDGGDLGLNAFKPGGGLLWHAVPAPVRYGVPSTPAVDSSGTIYYCTSNNLFAISSQGAVKWVAPGLDVPAGFSVFGQPPLIAPDGTIYVALGGTLYAIAGTNGPAKSPWPTYRQNARRTGKIEKPLLQQPKKRADANFEFQLYAQIDQTQTVQTSTDLVTWTALTNIAVTNVPMDVVDLCASNFPTRFYRTLSQ